MENQERKYRHKGEYVFRAVAGEAVLVPIRGGMAELSCVFTLNPVAAFIWGMFDPPRSIDEIADAVSLQYDVSPEQGLFDTAEFVEELREKSLIEAIGDTGIPVIDD